jgi:hypothetical protein
LEIRFSLQGRYASVLDLSAFCITNSAVSIHGSALHAGKGITEDEFINKHTEAELAGQFNSYLDRNLPNPGFNHLFILDMEPGYVKHDDSNEEINVQFSPSDLGNYEGELRDQLIKAYVRRIKVARNVLKRRWPRAGLETGLYGVVVPMGKGQENDAFLKRMEAYRRGSRLGMYDFLDYLVPVVYNRFGPSDVSLPGELDKLHGWIEKSTRQALENSQQLTRRNGDRIPLAPLLTFWVNNGSSTHHKKPILPQTMDLQLRILGEYRTVKITVLWSGSETREEMEETDFEPLEIDDFLGRVDSLPPISCA